MNRGKRLFAMLLDHIIMTTVILILYQITKIIDFSLSNILKDLWFILGLFLYVNKDIFSGRSIAKRILNFQVVDIKTGNIANELQAFLRNIFIIIWPIEIIIALKKPERRLGDIVARTKVVYGQPQKNSRKNSSFVVLLTTIVFSLIYSLLINYLLGFME